MEERRTSPVELLWDLVFVFAITQVTTLLSRDLSWPGFGHGMLVLALVWWAWSAYVWAANAEQQESRALRGVLLLGMVLIFIAGLSLPHAFGDRATVFACSYAGVRLLHLALYAHASVAALATMVLATLCASRRSGPRRYPAVAGRPGSKSRAAHQRDGIGGPPRELEPRHTQAARAVFHLPR